MAQPIAPEVWQEGIFENDKLPGRVVGKYFKGNNSAIKSIANDGESCRVYDMIVSDYITTYDDRRINGLKGTNTEGRDGWGASAYGVFQDVRFDSRVYTMGRHRSCALRVFDEMQYGGAMNTTTTAWGTATSTTNYTNGQALKKTAEKINMARKKWEDEVLAVDIDKYQLFAACNGHMSGRLVGKTRAIEDHVFSGDAADYQWIAQPGMVQGAVIKPEFAPIHCVTWDDTNIPLMLQNITVTWNNMFLPQDNRICLLDPFYQWRLMACLTGGAVPATEAGYTQMEEGKITRLMGWNFAFDIPSSYWPKIYVDLNNNVVHSEKTTSANLLDCDHMINSIAGTPNDDAKLLRQLLANERMGVTNWIRTDWDTANNKFVQTVTNYPLGTPSYDGYYAGTENESVAKIVAQGDAPITDIFGSASAVAGVDRGPFDNETGAGYGLNPATYTGTFAKATGPQFTAGGADLTSQQVIGLFLYQNAVQCSQEYSGMVTDDGKTRGKFTEMCYDVKYDCWVIEQYSHGVIPILAGANHLTSSALKFGIPVRQIS